MKKYRNKEKSLSGLTVAVRGDDIQGAMRVLKKRMQNEGIFNEMRERTSFKTRSERRRLEKEVSSSKKEDAATSISSMVTKKITKDMM